MNRTEAIIKLFRSGKDTVDIAKWFRLHEYEVVRIISADQDRRYAERQAKRGAA